MLAAVRPFLPHIVPDVSPARKVLRMRRREGQSGSDKLAVRCRWRPTSSLARDAGDGKPHVVQPVVGAPL